ncbi:hypothetical protein ACXN5S_08985 [Pseudoroseicyclus sp. H15]
MNEQRQIRGWGAARLAGAALVAGLAGCAVDELEAGDCASTAGFASRDIPRDLGNGTVLTRLSHSGGAEGDYWGAERYEIADCASGTWVRLTSMAFSSGGVVLTDRRETIEELIEGASALAGSAAAVYLAERAVSNNVEYRAGQSDDEFCACRVFYPQAAGDKTGFGETMNEGTT